MYQEATDTKQGHFSEQFLKKLPEIQNRISPSQFNLFLSLMKVFSSADTCTVGNMKALDIHPLETAPCFSKAKMLQF